MVYHVWFLNASESLFSLSKIRSRVEEILDVPVVWETRMVGERVTCNLMPDEEYFVPIAIKCLGNLWDNPVGITREGVCILNQMKKLYFDSWKLPFWKDFWDQPSSFRSMQTTPFIGYYELIQRRHREGNKHILIGYSQGGVVAEFLVFIYEYLYGRRHIDFVITIASPLQGSPLADSSCREVVTDALVKILMALFSSYEWYGHKPGFTRVIKYLEKSLDFEDVYGLLVEWIKDSLSLAEVFPYYGVIGKYLATFCKWLSGLKGIKESAFWELAPHRKLSPFSVLSVIQRPRRAKTYSIITANHDVGELVRDYLVLTRGWWVTWLWHFMRGWLLSRRVGGESLYSNIQTIQDIYDREIMGLEPHESHDFMVPSKNQYREKNPSFGFYFALKANHLSGKDPSSPGGKEIVNAIISALRQYRLCRK